MKKLAALLIWFACSLYGAGTVTATISQLSPSNNFMIKFAWTGDASSGTVPIVPANGGSSSVQQAFLAAMQGLIVVSSETQPGSPAPTNGYTVQILDASGADILGGNAATVSSTLSQIWGPSTSVPPLNGALSLKITGQSVASAKGTVYLFLGPITALVNVTGGGGGGSGVSSFNSRTGAVTLLSADVTGALGYTPGGQSASTAIQKGNGSGNFANAVAGTDYAAPTSGSVPLKGNGAGGFANTIAADIVTLFSGCSGVLYLGADGACHASGGGSSYTDNQTTTTSTAITLAAGDQRSWGGATSLASTSATITLASGTDTGTFYVGWLNNARACYYGAGITIGNWTVVNFAGGTCTSGTPPTDGQFAQAATVSVVGGTVGAAANVVIGTATTGKLTCGTDLTCTSTTPSADTTILAQKFFGTSAPGSVSGNLPGDFFNDTTNHHLYTCNAVAGTSAPACTSVTTNGWEQVDGGGGGSSAKVPIWMGQFIHTSGAGGAGVVNSSDWQIGSAQGFQGCSNNNTTTGNPPQTCQFGFTNVSGQLISYPWIWDTAITAVDVRFTFFGNYSNVGNYRFKAFLECHTLGTQWDAGTWTAGATSTSSTFSNTAGTQVDVAVAMTSIAIPTCAAGSTMALVVLRDQTVGSNSVDEARLLNGAIIATRSLP